MTAATSRAGTPSASSEAATRGSLAQAAASAWTSVAASISSPSETASPARSRSRSRADSAPIDAPALVDHAEVADMEPAHPADRAIDEGIGRNDRERLAHELLDRQRQRRAAMPRDRAQEIALGDDAGVGGERAARPARTAAMT